MGEEIFENCTQWVAGEVQDFICDSRGLYSSLLQPYNLKQLHKQKPRSIPQKGTERGFDHGRYMVKGFVLFPTKGCRRFVGYIVV